MITTETNAQDQTDRFDLRLSEHRSEHSFMTCSLCTGRINSFHFRMTATARWTTHYDVSHPELTHSRRHENRSALQTSHLGGSGPTSRVVGVGLECDISYDRCLEVVPTSKIGISSASSAAHRSS